MIKKGYQRNSKIRTTKNYKNWKKNDLTKELSNIDSKLKELNSLKDQYDKIQVGINQFFNYDKNKN